jgi:hypothetical protein
MTRNMPQPGRRNPARPWLNRLAAATSFAVLALSAAPAMATSTTLDFDSIDYGWVGAGDQVEHNGVLLTGYSNDPDALPGDNVGAVFNGNNPYACTGGLSCPTNNFTPGYYAGLNDGVLLIDPLQAQQGLHVKSFDASYIGPYIGNGAEYPLIPGLLEVRGFHADGSYVAERFALGGPIGIEFMMQHYVTSDSFAATAFAEVAIFAYRCDDSGSCAAFSTNGGQFALDNVAMEISPVPEPSSWLMLGGGLAALGLLRRRA